MQEIHKNLTALFQAYLLPHGAFIEGYSGTLELWIFNATAPLVAARFYLRDEAGLRRGEEGGEADGGDHDERQVRLHPCSCALIEGPRSQLILGETEVT